MIRQVLGKLGSLTGLITIPGSLALVLWLLAWPSLHLDRSGGVGLPSMESGTAISFLGTVSSAAITTLSLVYSIVLVVFTLAAGNIAPRLLRRFTKDRVNQATAGLLGGTYLFSLTVLHETRTDFVPAFSIAMAFVLAAITVLQLIFFVHTVSKSVTIDEEIAAISRQLAAQLAAIVADEEEVSHERLDIDRQDWVKVVAPKAGYLTAIDHQRILSSATDADTVVMINAKPGSFLLQGQPFCSIRRTDGDEAMVGVRSAVLASCRFSPSRGSQDDVEYAVNLLVEIALRALSPGVNDTYTAIACVDQLSAAYQDVVTKGLRERGMADADGNLRLMVEGLSVADLINTAFNPLRRAASGNALMLINLGDGLSRLHAVANDAVREELRRHLRLLIEEFEHTDPLAHDAAFLRDRYADLVT